MPEEGRAGRISALAKEKPWPTRATNPDAAAASCCSWLLIYLRQGYPATKTRKTEVDAIVARRAALSSSWCGHRFSSFMASTTRFWKLRGMTNTTAIVTDYRSTPAMAHPAQIGAGHLFNFLRWNPSLGQGRMLRSVIAPTARRMSCTWMMPKRWPFNWWDYMDCGVGPFALIMPDAVLAAADIGRRQLASRDGWFCWTPLIRYGTRCFTKLHMPWRPAMGMGQSGSGNARRLEPSRFGATAISTSDRPSQRRRNTGWDARLANGGSIGVDWPTVGMSADGASSH